MQGLADLLYLHSKAVAAHVEALQELTDAIGAALRLRPMPDRLRGLAGEASDKMYPLQRCRGAFAVFACMAEYTVDAGDEELSDGVDTLTGAMDERAQALEAALSELREALPAIGDTPASQPPGGAA